MTELSPTQKNFVLEWAKEQKVLDTWKPLNKSSDTAVLLGGATFRMEERLNYLIGLWNQGVCFHEIVWLVGDRPLDSNVENFINSATTESEAAHIIWREANMPDQMRNLPIRFLSAPMKIQGNLIKRPSTKDTINAWVESTPESKKALFVSNQPFCGYQFAVIKSNLPKSIQFDVVGPEASLKDSQAPAAVILDTVARWIYQEEKCN